jgi:hypothetical protein
VKKKIFFVFLSLFALSSLFSVFPKSALAAIDCLSRNPTRGCPANQPAACPDSTMCCKDAGMCPATLPQLEGVFSQVVGYALGLAGIVLFVLLLIGGFKYITSNGDPKAVEGAKATLTHAVLGLVIVLASYLIMVFISKLTGVNVTEFKITLP